MRQNNKVEYSSSTWIGDRVRLRQLIFHISRFDDDVDENNSDENGDDECYQRKQNDTHTYTYVIFVEGCLEAVFTFK